MKKTVFLKSALLVFTLALASCKTQTSVQQPTVKPTTETNTPQMQVLHKVADNAQYAPCITSKIRFKIKMGDKDVTLGGSLKMKRDDVIRLQLTALGLFEAGRLEFTKDYVLVMDRINKQYIKVDYSQVDFLKQSGLNFYSLQALFWNELFLPGTNKMTDESLKRYAVDMTGAQAGISLSKGPLTYKWTADKGNGHIQDFCGTYADSHTGTVRIDWTYGNFKPMGSKQFPTQDNITINVPKKTINAELQLSSPNNDSDWETRTEVNGKYKQVSLDDILKKLSAL